MAVIQLGNKSKESALVRGVGRGIKLLALRQNPCNIVLYQRLARVSAGVL